MRVGLERSLSRTVSLERIGVEAFGAVWGVVQPTPCGLEEIRIPDSVRELCDGCFKGCSRLRRVTFGPSSSLERIGVEAFGAVQAGGQSTPCGLEEISIPNGVRELCDDCFKRCKSLRRVTFGPSSSLERIGADCFYRCGLVEFEIPASLRKIGGGAFGECALTGGIVCHNGCRFRAIEGFVFLRKSVSPTVSVSCVMAASRGARVCAV